MSKVKQETQELEVWKVISLDRQSCISIYTQLKKFVMQYPVNTWVKPPANTLIYAFESKQLAEVWSSLLANTIHLHTPLPHHPSFPSLTVSTQSQVVRAKAKTKYANRTPDLVSIAYLLHEFNQETVIEKFWEIVWQQINTSPEETDKIRKLKEKLTGVYNQPPVGTIGVEELMCLE